MNILQALDLANEIRLILDHANGTHTLEEIVRKQQELIVFLLGHVDLQKQEKKHYNQREDW